MKSSALCIGSFILFLTCGCGESHIGDEKLPKMHLMDGVVSVESQSVNSGPSYTAKIFDPIADPETARIRRILQLTTIPSFLHNDDEMRNLLDKSYLELMQMNEDEMPTQLKSCLNPRTESLLKNISYKEDKTLYMTTIFCHTYALMKFLNLDEYFASKGKVSEMFRATCGPTSHTFEKYPSHRRYL